VSGTRKRGSELENAILDAAIAELRDGGYAALTMDRVARAAGTNKNAIYRRWPNRAALGVAAYRRMTAPAPAPPDTGSLREDLLELLRRANRTWTSPYGEILRALLAGAAEDPELRPLLRGHTGHAEGAGHAGGQGDASAAGHAEGAGGGSDPWLAVLERAVARGDAPPEALHPRVASAPVALLRNEYVTRGEPSAPDATLVEIVDEVVLPLIRGRAG